MTRATPTLTAPATAPEALPAAPPRVRRSLRTVACASLTLAALATALLGPAPARTWLVPALAAAVVVGGGWPVHRAAWAALRRGPCVDLLPAAGLLAALGAALASSTPVLAAAATTLLLAGRDGLAAARRRTAPETGPEVLTRAADVAERVADRSTGGMACLVAALGVATLGFWLGAGAGAGAALGAAGAVLLVACPRVVGGVLSATLRAANRRAGQLGVVPAGPRMLERAARVDTVVLCRTGTVTVGVRQLHAVHVADGVDADEVLRMAGTVAVAAQEVGGPAGSHAVVAVVARAAQDRFPVLPDVAEFDGYPGLGVRGIVSELVLDGDDAPRVIAHATLVGRAELLAAHGIGLPPELAAAVDEAHADGATTVAVSWDGVARAVLELADPVRPGAADAVRRLRGLGLDPVLLARDAAAARGVATALGLPTDRVLADADRAAAVGGLRAQGRTVAVLGGPADTPALAAADVALVRSGAPGAGIALRDDDPLTAVDALHLARRTARTVERGLTAAAGYHLVAVPAAAAGLLPPLAAAALGAAYPVAAALHAALLRRVPAVARPVP